jgi:hypothetical protein
MRLCRHSNRSLFASGNSAGKRFGEARDWGAIPATPADFGRQRPRHPASPAAKPRKVKDFPNAPGNRNCAGLRGGGGSPIRTGLCRIFPANREKNREFRENRPSQSILKRLLSASSITCARNSLRLQTGIFFRGTGNCLDRTGKRRE